MTDVLVPKESIGKVDLLLGQATTVTVDLWDETAGEIQEAMGIVLLMAATFPISQPVHVPGVARMSAWDCVDQALLEVHSWDLGLAAVLPELARLRVLLADLRRDLNATAAGQG